jgi:two-component system sensor histidine kinase UhpB
VNTSSPIVFNDILPLMKTSGTLKGLWKKLGRVSLFTRIAVGNALVISAGAVGGTLLTRHYSHVLDGWLIGLFAAIGISLSLLVNFLILEAALRPLRELRKQAEAASRPGSGSLKFERLKNPDADTVSLAAALRSLVRQLEERNQELHALSGRAINAQEEERKSIARSLHDDTGQALTMLIISLDRLEGHLAIGQDDLKRDVQAARLLASNALTELRRIVFGLRPTILDDLGLVSAIRWYARSSLEPAGVQFEVESPPEPMPGLPPETSITLFRIAQEAVNNILRHAAASSVNIRIELQEASICLEVKDDGRGFNLQTASDEALSSHHLGLLGLRERAELLGGEVSLESSPGRGTRLQVCLPLSGTIGDNEKDSHSAG